MRKNYIDNLRNMTVLLLFPIHTFMIWNDFGSGFYIWNGGNRWISTWIVLVNPWFMPLLFVLAGMSARYALEKRSGREFMLQRVQKLLIPLLFGIIFLVPFQTWFARKFFTAYEGGILENLSYFFTHVTDLSGYDGAFTPGHLWFILFLFIISAVSLLIFRFVPYQKVQEKVETMPIWALAALFIPIWLMYYLGNFGGYSLGKDLTLFLIGYYILSNDGVADTLERNRKGLLVSGIVGITALGVLYYRYAYYGDIGVNAIGWISILAILAWGKKYFNQKTGFTEYFNKASYPIYILHQSILVAVAYYVLPRCDGIGRPLIWIGTGSFLLTVAAYQLLRGIPVIRRMVGIQK